jgi:DNA-binding CsgD family transcriptional regulator
MSELETNDWIVINNIIYDIYTIKNIEEMQRKFLEHLMSIVEYDAGDFCLASKESVAGIDSVVAYGYDGRDVIKYDDLDYSPDIMYSGRSLVYRESDIMSEKKRMNTDYYKLFYETNNFHYSIQLILGYEGQFMGVVTLYRLKGKPDFDYYDIFVLDILKDHMSYSLNQRRSIQNDISALTDVEGFIQKYSLTKRESEVLMHILSRQDNVIISEELSISLNTLKKHERNIYQKCNVSSRMQLFKLVSSYQ